MDSGGGRGPAARKNTRADAQDLGSALPAAVAALAHATTAPWPAAPKSFVEEQRQQERERGLSHDLFVGAPIHKPEGFRTAGTTAGFSLNYSF